MIYTLLILSAFVIDPTLLNIIPPVAASILAFLVATKRAKIQYANTISNIQYKAIEIVSAAEQKMRSEIREELNHVRVENEKLREDLRLLYRKLEDSEELIRTLRAEILSLRSLVDTYKEQINAMKT